MKLVDTHCHLYEESYIDNMEEIMEIINKEMDFAVSIGCDEQSFQGTIDLANKYDNIYAVIGIHPTDIKEYTDELEEKLQKYIDNNEKLIAIGEIGLDYYWMKYEPEKQKEYFRRQLALAQKNGLPVSIHARDAIEDTIEILQEFKDIKGILHCYAGTYEQAEPILDRFYIGVGGTVTFKNNHIGKEMVTKTPMDRIVLETDSPYLTPMPYRGKLNFPYYTKYVAEKISELKGISYQEVVDITNNNARKAYGI